MIRVDVEGYCHQCLDFEADVVKPIRITDAFGESLFTDTVVTCVYRKRCAVIKRFLEQQAKTEVSE